MLDLGSLVFIEEDKSLEKTEPKSSIVDKGKLFYPDEEKAPQIPKSDTQSTFDPDLDGEKTPSKSPQMEEEKAPQIPKSDTQSTFDPKLEREEKAPQLSKMETQSTFNPDLENSDSESNNFSKWLKVIKDLFSED